MDRRNEDMPPDLRADYEAAGFGGTLVPGERPAVVLVDFARAYFDRDCGLYAGVEAERAVARELTEVARTAFVPVIFTRVEYGTPADGGQFYRKVPALRAFDTGSPFADFTPELSPQPGDVVTTKQYPSAFFGTDLAERLHAMGIDTLLIAGLTTSGCVRATALDALCHGFVPLVIEDACGDRDKGVHNATIFDLRSKYAEIWKSSDALVYLRR
ncbi:MAG: isochorismatase family protein [Sphingomonadales bacterium]